MKPVVYDATIPPQWLSSVMPMMPLKRRSTTFKVGETTQHVPNTDVRNSYSLPRAEPVLQPAFDFMRLFAWQGARQFTPDAKGIEPGFRQVLIYEDGGFFLEHCDDSIKVNGKWDRNRPERELVSLLYLNGDFGGGEIVFSQHDLSVRPAPGRIVVFPGTPEYLHRVEKVTGGPRVAITQWFRILR